MIILLLNIVCAVVIAIVNMQFLVSFEVAFIGSALVVFSSYKAIMDKIKIASVESSEATSRQDAESRAESQIDSNDSKDSSKGDSTNCHSPKWICDDEAMKDSGDSAECVQIPRKERIFLGFKLSFGILRLLSYTFIAVSVVVLINHKLFFAIPFLCGIALSSVALAIYASKNSK